MGHQIDGILPVDKTEGETSHDVVKKVKSALGLKGCKVGHAGTLDPFATGLLIILLGQGTKLSRFIMSQDKVYLGTMRLGVETDTLDCTGSVVCTGIVPELGIEQIRDKARQFVGEIEQSPPIYSALRYKGTRAYKLARRGEEICLKKRNVTVYSLTIYSVDLPDVTMGVKCSSGTYIRSLAADLGKCLGPGGHLTSLRRLASGTFKSEDALSSGELLIKDRERFSVLRDKVIPLRAALPGMQEINVRDLLAKKVRHGYQPVLEDFAGEWDMAGFEDCNVKLVRDGELVAIMKANKSEGVDHGKIRIERVFL
jgi:tRNA pseudouridine55 synthase